MTITFKESEVVKNTHDVFINGNPTGSILAWEGRPHYITATKGVCAGNVLDAFDASRREFKSSS